MAQRVPLIGGEQEILVIALDRHREAALWKLEGLDDQQLRRPMTASGTTLLGLIKHLGAVDYGWFCASFDQPHEPLPFDDGDPDADLRVGPNESTTDILAFYDRARSAANTAVDRLGIDAIGTAWSGESVSMRWVLIHMIEETARHVGQMDIMRELLDGTTGDHDRS